LSRLFHQAGLLLLVIALLASAGGHWVVLQSVAWTSMLVERSRELTMVEAIKVTFDGSHPCGLCRKIESGSKKEKREEKARSVAKLELFYEPMRCPLFPPRGARLSAATHATAPARAQAPRVPPPRGC
jgi:hypothetical protein